MRRGIVIAGVLIAALLLVSTVLVRETWCDAWGWPNTRLHGDNSVYVQPPLFAAEVSPGCFNVPWWAS